MIYINQSGNGIYKIVGKYQNKKDAYNALLAFKVDLKHHYYLSTKGTQTIKILHREDSKHTKKTIKKEVIQIIENLEQGLLF